MSFVSHVYTEETDNKEAIVAKLNLFQILSKYVSWANQTERE